MNTPQRPIPISGFATPIPINDVYMLDVGSLTPVSLSIYRVQCNVFVHLTTKYLYILVYPYICHSSQLSTHCLTLSTDFPFLVFSTSVCNLGVVLEQELTFSEHFNIFAVFAFYSYSNWGSFPVHFNPMTHLHTFRPIVNCISSVAGLNTAVSSILVSLCSALRI